VGRGEERHFTTYHRVLNHATWSPLLLSRLLLMRFVTTFQAQERPVLVVMDGALERRWGRKIALKGRFHDAVRSQAGHVVTTQGVHWLSVMLLVTVPWCARPGAVPFLSVPTRCPATSLKRGRRQRTMPV
jgi:DDE superfamily endonuclease